MASRVTSVFLVPATLIAWLSPLDIEARTLAPPEGEGPVEAPSEPPSQPSSEPASGEDEAVEQAQRLFEEGAIKYETADYIGAIERWTEAFGMVPSVPENAPVKAKLIANIAAAQERAYLVDGRVSHLKQAKILLEQYRSGLDEIYLDELEREKEVAWIDDRLAKIDAELQAVVEREAADRAAERSTEQPEQAEQPEQPPPGRGLVIGGSVAMGIELAGLSIMIAGMVIGENNDDISDLPTTDLDTRAERFRMGRLGNGMAIGGAVAGGVMLGAGVALLVVGLQKQRAAGQDTAKVTAKVMVVPTFDATQAGVGLVGRF
jgi:hypothetical protein